MKAVFVTGRNQLDVREVPEPAPHPDEVLVKVGACGVCGSDLRYLAGDNPWSLQTLGEQRANPPEMVLGHEFGGEIVAVGASVPESRLGERIAVLAYRGCGRCRYCQSGRHNLCADVEHLGHSAGWDTDEWNPGGMAGVCRVWDEMAFSIPDSISDEEATLLDGLAVAVHACNKAQIGVGDDVSIIGTGPLGLLILQVAQLSGARSVSCSDTYAAPLDVASSLGASDCFNIEAEERPPSAESADVVFNTIGAAASIRGSLAALRRGGRLVLLAIPTGEIALEGPLLSGERQVLTSANNAYPCFRQAVDLMAAGRVSAAPLITHRFPISQAQQAFSVAANKEEHGAIKVLIVPGEQRHGPLRTVGGNLTDR